MKSTRKKSTRQKPKPRRQHREISLKSGLPPESLVHVGQVFMENTEIDLIAYNAKDFKHELHFKPDGFDTKDASLHKWIKVCGLHEVELIGSLGKMLNISQLLIEDVLNTGHRPKLEEDQDYIFLTLKFFTDSETGINSEQVSFLLGKGYLVSFQETDRPIFDPIIARLDSSSGKIRQKGLDYLLYNLIDGIVDQYYYILEKVGDQLEDLEEQIFDHPDRNLIERTQEIRKNIVTIRKALIPTQEAVGMLIKTDSNLLEDSNIRYFSDIQDHVIQSIDFIDGYRELSAEIKEAYLSNITYKMNQVIKLLTIITTIFIPLTFIAGVYGMNFRYMPELEWRYGYFAILGLMLSLLIGMLIYFKVKKWI